MLFHVLRAVKVITGNACTTTTFSNDELQIKAGLIEKYFLFQTCM